MIWGGRMTAQSTSSSNEAVPWTMQRRGLLGRARPRGNQSPAQVFWVPDVRLDLVGADEFSVVCESLRHTDPQSA